MGQFGIGTCTLTVVDLKFTPNGGTYVIPETGTASIKTTVTIEGASKARYGWNTSQMLPSSLSEFSQVTGGEVSTSKTTEGNNYIGVEVSDTYGNKVTYVSNNFNVLGKQTIALKPDITTTTIKTTEGNKTTNYVNKDVTVTATWPENIVVDRQLTSTGTNGTDYTSNSPTSITIKTNNQTVTASGKDASGANTTQATLKISNIDKIIPTIGNATGSTETGNTGKISVSNITDTGVGGIYGYYITGPSNTQPTEPTATSVSWTRSTANTITKEVQENGNYYIWVIDGAGNVSTVKKVTVSGIVPKVSNITYDDLTIVENNSTTKTTSTSGNTTTMIFTNPTSTVTQNLTYSGTPKSITFSSSNTGIATVNASTGVITAISEGSTTITVQFTDYDGTIITKTCTVTVEKAIAKIEDTGIYYNAIASAIRAVPTDNVQKTVTLLVDRTEDVYRRYK